MGKGCFRWGKREPFEDVVGKDDENKLGTDQSTGEQSEHALRPETRCDFYQKYIFMSLCDWSTSS